eukprot:EG_transcript_8956
MVPWKLFALMLSLWCGFTSCLMVHEKAGPAAERSLLRSRAAAPVRFELHDAPTGTYIVVPKRPGDPPCEGSHAHFGWNQEAGAYITDWLQREYTTTYTVCRLAEEGWTAVSDVQPHFLNTVTLAPLTLFCFLFVTLCTIFGVPTGSLDLVLATGLLTKVLLSVDLCYNDRELLLVLGLLVGALHALRDHPLPTLTILPVLLAGAAYAADALFSADLLRVDCLQKEVAHLAPWLLEALQHLGVPWLAKWILEGRYTTGLKRFLPPVAALGLGLISYLGLTYHALAAAVLLVTLALNEPPAAEETKPQEEQPVRVTRSRTRNSVISPPPPPPPLAASVTSPPPLYRRLTPQSLSGLSQRVWSPFRDFKREDTVKVESQATAVPSSQGSQPSQAPVVQVGSAHPQEPPRRAPPPPVATEDSEEASDDAMLLDSPSHRLRKRKAPSESPSPFKRRELI